MNGKSNQPKTLQAAIVFFSNPENCLTYSIRLRWPDGVVTCPACGRTDIVFLKNQRKWQCKSVHPKRQFSAKVGTIFEDSPIPMDKWLTAVWMLSNCKNGVSSYEIARAIGVTQKSAWFMLHRIRFALRMKDDGSKLGTIGFREVEVDETFIGGKMRNMHRERRTRFASVNGHVGGPTGKTAVVGLLDRSAREMRATVVGDVKRMTLQTEVLKHVKHGASVYTDSHTGYDRLKDHRYLHDVVNHAERYVNGRVHTNGLENFWSLLKRTLTGTYVAVEPFHLARYVDEQVFRFNNRKHKDRSLVSDSERFERAISQVADKRLTFAELTGKVGETIH